MPLSTRGPFTTGDSFTTAPAFYAGSSSESAVIHDKDGDVLPPDALTASSMIGVAGLITIVDDGGAPVNIFLDYRY